MAVCGMVESAQKAIIPLVCEAMRPPENEDRAVEVPTMNEQPKARLVFLVGFMGAGKTSVGREAARVLGWPFVDLDDEVEAASGCSVAEIFREKGEAEFRKLEHEALRRLIERLNGAAVIALGGGAFVQEANAALIREADGISILLDAPVEELRRRCKEVGRERPLASDEERFRRLYEERLPAYATADERISTAGRNVPTVAKAVRRAIMARQKH